MRYVIREPMDFQAYAERVRTGPCFVCAFLAGHEDYRHELVYDDGEHVGFLTREPTLYGYTLVCPRRHVEDVVRDLTPAQYLALQSVVHTVARALADVTGAERIYLLSLGSMQGNAHVHWHVAPLPPGVPYERQQFHALMAENGVLRLEPAQQRDLGPRIRERLERIAAEEGDESV
jgi:histidine triad (HIT) family protein/ATP adenylyltransferase